METVNLETVNLILPIYKYSFPQLITKQVCEQYKSNFPRSNTSNVKAWHSDYFSHKKTDVFKPLIDVTLSKCYDISDQFLGTDITHDSRFFVENLWVAMYEKNDHTLPHHHFPYHFSACYYVDVNDDSSPITYGVDDITTSIQPENGMLLIWLGILPHKVAPTNTERTCICMNMSIKTITRDNIPIFN